MSQRSDPFERPLDKALLGLRERGLPYRWAERDVKVWEAVCPVCQTPEWGMRIREAWHGGPINFHCTAGCTDADVRETLATDASGISATDALRLAEDARDIAQRAVALAVEAVTSEAPAELLEAA